MNSAALKLAAALRRRLEMVSDQESRRDTEKHIERLRRVSEQIESLVAELPTPIHPQLRHYLAQSSYNKALEFIESNRDERLQASP